MQGLHAPDLLDQRQEDMSESSTNQEHDAGSAAGPIRRTSSRNETRQRILEVLENAISLVDTDDDLIKIGAILGNPLRSMHQDEDGNTVGYRRDHDSVSSTGRRLSSAPMVNILHVLDTAISMEMATNQGRVATDEGSNGHSDQQQDNLDRSRIAHNSNPAGERTGRHT